MKLIQLCLPGYRVRRVCLECSARRCSRNCALSVALEAFSMGYFFPTDFKNVVQRRSLRAARHPPFPPPLLHDCVTIYSRLGSNPQPMAHKAIALTTELEGLPCISSFFSCSSLLASTAPPMTASCEDERLEV